MAARASKSKRTERRQRRERIARSRCSNSSLDHEIGEDYLVPGYSSNETLKAYEKEGLSDLNTLSPTTIQETENTPGIMSTSEPNIISSHRPSGKDKMSLERNPRPPPPDLTPDQLLMAVDNYLKKQVRHHTNREDQSESGRSSRSSLTLTETEMEDGLSGIPSAVQSRHSLGRQHMMRPNIVADRSASSLISSGRSAPGTLSNVRSSHSTISSMEAGNTAENAFQMKQMSNTMPQNNFIQNQALPSIPVEGKQNIQIRPEAVNLNYPQPGPNPMFNSNNSLSNSRQTSISRHMYEFPPNSPTAAVPLPSFTPVRNDNRPKNNKFAQPKYRRIKSKYSCWDHCSWKCMAVVLFILVCALIAALICLTAVKFFQPETHPVIAVGAKTDNPGYYTPVGGPTNLPDPTSLPLVAERVRLGQHIRKPVQSGDFLQIIMQIDHPKYVQMNLTVGHHAFLAVYGRRGGPPTHTVYDFVEVHSGRGYLHDRSRRHTLKNSAIFGRSSSHHHPEENRKRHGGKTLAVRQERSMAAKTIFSFIEFLDEGSWYIGIFNDGKRTEDVKFVSGVKGDGGIPCLNDCNGNGQCVDGQCKCFPTYTGEDCLKGICPILCSTHGKFHDGVCHCNVGWTGAECQIEENRCLDPDCSGNGRCINSVCVCNEGFGGPACQEADCMEHTCSGNGICQKAICSCHPGWTGTRCHIPVNPGKQAQGEITSNSVYNGQLTNVLVGPAHLKPPNTPWVTELGYGPSPSQASSDYSTVDNGDDHILKKVVQYCEIDRECGNKGECLEGQCRCLPGWGGVNCSAELCTANCGDHGTCEGNMCVCDQGWNGKFCSLEGCPSLCNGNGLCKKVDGEWKCICPRGFGGESCDITKELDCEDTMDNDGDLLMDCEDPDCCMRAVCSTDSICRTVPNPTVRLTQREATSRSFYDRMKFLIQPNSVQIGAQIEERQKKHTSVVRGMVTTEDGSPLIGVMVTVLNNPALGRTYTRYDGIFDMLVVGGGSIQLQFTREPLAMTTVAILVPYGDFIYIDNIVMILAGMDSDDDVPTGARNCFGTHHDRPSFVVLPSMAGTDAACSKNGVMLDRKIVHERILIPQTKFSLDYLSSDAPDYESTISIQLTNDLTEDDPIIVHIHISVQGKLFKKRLEPEPYLQYTFGWNRTNAYGQKVYGEVTAIVSVGYEFKGCEKILWDKQAVKIQGYDYNFSGLAGWNLPMLYSYNPIQGAVSGGDGSHIFLHNEPKVINTIMGNGKLRSLPCTQCDGLAKDAKMRAPIALAADSKGNIYVGDFNFIRKIDLGGNASNLVKLSENPTYKYYLATSPLDGEVYLSSNQNRRIYRILNKSSPHDVENNLQVVAGTGGLCLPVDAYRCGDGGPADEAKLISPKGITVANDGSVYFVDGNIIRMISPDGVISTHLGSHSLLTAPRAFACDRSMSFEEVNLNQPTEMSINRIDNSLYVVDDDVVLRITMDNQVTIAAGVPTGCHTSQSHIQHSDDDSTDVAIAANEVLVSPSAIALTYDGKLYIAETNLEGINRVRLVTPNGMIQRFVGRDSSCDCMQDTCDCFDGNKSVAVDTLLHAPTALTTLSDGTLVIADQGNLRIRTVGSSVPIVKRHQVYEIPSESKTEVLVFDSFGQHIKTRDTLTEQVLYNFTYTSKKLLKSITDVYGSVITIHYNSDNKPTQMLVPTGDAIQLSVSRKGFLTRVSGVGLNIAIKYTSEESGLLQKMIGKSGEFQTYNYDQFGHLMSIVSPTGYTSSIASRLNRTHSIVSVGSAVDTRTISFSQRLPHSVNHNLVKGDISTAVSIQNDGASIIKYPNDGSIILEPGRHPLFQGDPVILTTKRKISFPGSNVHRLEWRFYGRRGGRQGRRKIIIVGRRLRVNGDNVLTFEYNRFTRAESIKLGNDEEILTIHHDNGHPNEWRPNNGILPVNVSYDNRGRFIKWQQGLLIESFRYDNAGHMTGRAYDNDMTKAWKFTYDRDGNLDEVILPSGNSYLLAYDNLGFLATIIMPSGLRHNVVTSTGLGFYRKIYSSYNNTAWLVVDESTSKKPLRLFYPRTKRQVQYLYDTQDRLSSVIDEQQITKFSYYKNSGQLRTVDIETADYNHQLRYKYFGSLISQQVVRTPSEADSVSVRFIYEYDENFKVVSIKSEFNSTDVADYTRRYDSKKGLLVEFGGFNVRYDYTSTIMQAISDKTFSMQKQFGSYILLQSVQYQIENDRLFVMTLLYDTHGRVANRSIEFAGHRDVMSYSYNEDGQLIEVEKNSNPQWHYSYDRNGNMETISTGGSVTTLEYDNEDRITKYGAVNYKIDKDGFLTHRGNEVFEYNSEGQLIHAHQENQYEVWYRYDGLKRRIWRKDSHGEQTQYFYADVDRPSRITHIFEHATQEMWILDYDLQGHLFSINKGGTQLYVATDHVGTPYGMFNTAGEIRREITYTPFGGVIADLFPDFILHIGFMGGLYDPLTHLVHINKRDYDPRIGRWTSPDVDFYNAIGKAQKTKLLNLYTFFGNNPTNLDQERNYYMDTSSWLPVLGFNIENMMPQVTSRGEVWRGSPSDWKESTNMCQDSTSPMCRFANQLDAFNIHFKANPTTQLIPSVLDQTSKSCSNLRSKAGLQLSLKRGILLVKPPEGGSNIDRNVAAVLSGTIPLQHLRQYDNTKEHVYLVKESGFMNDLGLFGLTQSLSQRTIGQYNITVVQRSLDHRGLDISTDNTVWHIYYGVSVSDATAKVLEYAKLVATEDAWKKEQANLIDMKKGRREWSAEEKRQIIEHGSLLEYDSYYVMDISTYPQIAFDGNSITFLTPEEAKFHPIMR
ncbi:teneurin-3-like isoform X2 [Anneissia japonica]|uniref:teneurin-3-like isoform X2 n=1 Tax=Anneissia japonica TaxID=1529436 RepID=UPI0014254E4A|nr:teneurin-3-like isoform X2 [Anneissia japonica]